MPESLKTLQFGRKFNKTLDPSILPKNLKVFVATGKYLSKLRKQKMPKKLTFDELSDYSSSDNSSSNNSSALSALFLHHQNSNDDIKYNNNDYDKIPPEYYTNGNGSVSSHFAPIVTLKENSFSPNGSIMSSSDSRNEFDSGIYEEATDLRVNINKNCMERMPNDDSSSLK